MRANDVVDRVVPHHATFDHGDRPAEGLFGWLEQQRELAGELVSRRRARISATPRRLAVWTSWPQACMTPSITRRVRKIAFSSVTGSASMSARIMTRRPGAAPDKTRDGAGLGRTRSEVEAEGGETVLYDLGGAILLERQFGVSMEVVAKIDHRVIHRVEQSGQVVSEGAGHGRMVVKAARIDRTEVG